MSLINQLLKDLETRQIHPRPSDADLLEGLYSSPSRENNQSRFWITLLALIILVLSALVFYLLWTKPPLTLHHTQVVPPQKVVTQKPIEVITVKPVEAITQKSVEVVTTKPKKVVEQIAAVPPKAVNNTQAKMPHIRKTPSKLDAKQRLEKQYEQALIDIEAGEVQSAIDTLRDVVKRAPDKGEAREDLAGLLLQEGNTGEAKQVIDKGLALEPGNAVLAELGARILMANGDFPKALDMLLKANPTLNDNPDYYAMIASLYQHLGQPLLAAQVYEELVKVVPDNAIWWMGLGIALETAGRPHVALEAFERAKQNRLNPQLQMYINSRIDKLKG